MAKRKTRASRGVRNDFEFNLSYWLRKYRLSDLETYFVSQAGPDRVFFGELLRRAAGIDVKDSEYEKWHVPCDLFVFGCGPSPRRDLTGYGGLPYRRASLPWPRSSRTGQPLIFIGQFRLKESTDILGKLPGDLLLVFVESFQDWNVVDVDPPYCEWQTCDIPAHELAQPEDIPDMIPAKIPMSYAVRHRSTDLIDLHSTLYACLTLLELNLRDDAHYLFLESAPFHHTVRSWVCQSRMPKAGGIPFLTRPIEWMHKGLNRGKFLLQIPDAPEGWAEKECWLNCSTEKEYLEMNQDGFFFWQGQFCQDGSLLLYMNDDGSVEPRFAYTSC
jgi:hypothetical protein